jgi:MFS family permease
MHCDGDGGMKRRTLSMNTARPAAFWIVLCGGIIMGLSLGARHVQGLFLLPMTTDRGWSREAFAIAIALQNLVWGFAQPFTGMIADRFGSVRVLLGGLALYAAGLGLMSTATSALGFTLSAGILVGVALSATSFAVVYGALGRIVAPHRRSWALGLAGAFGGLGQFLMVPGTQALLDSLDWTVSLLVLAAVAACLLPLAFALRDDRNLAGEPGPAQSMRAAIAEAFSHRGFWLLNMGFLACGFQLAFIGTHLPAYLLDHGLQPRTAVIALSLVALANIAGTYLCGHLGGLYRRKNLLGAIYLIRSLAIALFMLRPPSEASVYAFSLVMGLVWLGTVPLTTGVVAQVFGVRYLSTLFGFVFFGHQLGAFFGVWLGGYVFDATHTYDAIWLGAILLGIAAAALHWPIDDAQVRRLAQPA